MKLYGNEHALAALEAMCTSGRLPHSFLIYGEQGTGKKTLAWYLAARLLCEGAQKPCGSCKPCHNLEHRQHPDVMEIPHSGKTGGFSVESIRRVCADAYKTPNNGMRKLYLFTDADHMTVQAQNALLKLVEEPPDFTYFVFTAQSRHAFLETILSRVSAIGTSPCTDAQCTQALLSAGHTPEEAAWAVSVFHGNIGRCLAYLTDPGLQETVALTKKLADSIMNRDEYALLAALTACSTDKSRLMTALELLDRQLRDALCLRSGGGACIGCYPEGAAQFAQRITLAQGEHLHSALLRTVQDLEGNVSPALAVSALCADIMTENGK
ncbi:ATP-binding protein [Ruminococcus sp.]|uniref:DNA polymerase III subunit n=1 Tax=Ruminococcus sp. TaxID=41978 RepID=UPI003F121AAE